jgi:hypothetical protein
MRFDLLKTICPKERQSKGMKRGTRRMYGAHLAFYEARVVAMVCRSFESAGFLLDFGNMRIRVQIDLSSVLA